MSDTTKYTNKLQGQRVLVFGGTSGLGFAVAEASIEHGAEVFISSSNQNKIDNTVDRILKAYPSAKGRISGFTCNLGDATTLEQNVIKLLDQVGKVDHIIHTAGDPLVNIPLSEVTVDVGIKAAMVRYYAPLMIGKHASAHLKGGPQSSLTLTTGGITERPRPDWTLTAGVMSGVHGMMRNLALDLAPIRVNVVCPGAVETELWNHLGDADFQAFKKLCEDNNPTGRLAQPEDVAESYLYLMRAINVTGSVIHTDSGHHLK